MSYWDTIEVGAVETVGTHVFTAEAIKRFAARYDPQPFHLDEEQAKASLFGGLCASGWHTASVYMRLNVVHRDTQLAEWQSQGNKRPAFGPSPGVTNLRWLRPVFAGDLVTYCQTVTSKRLSASRPSWGVAETRIEAVNQDAMPVFSMEGAVFIETA